MSFLVLDIEYYMSYSVNFIFVATLVEYVKALSNILCLCILLSRLRIVFWGFVYDPDVPPPQSARPAVRNPVDTRPQAGCIQMRPKASSIRNSAKIWAHPKSG